MRKFHTANDYCHYIRHDEIHDEWIIWRLWLFTNRLRIFMYLEKIQKQK